jgi:glyoxylase-like metal-dependent hydrolase (beta-lactamase superfamily II)/rhodanese-related sulfurtransferase
MILEQLNLGACKTYLVASEQAGEALLVDPLRAGVERYLAELQRRGLRLRYLLDTHVHADHLSGAAELQARTGVPYLVHRLSASACARSRVDEGQELELGELRLGFLHTPGHAPDSLTVLLPGKLLTGDFLFIGEGGAGRTDLPGGDAGEHWDALQKLVGLPDALEVHPGHDYHGHAASTLGQERRSNPRLLPRGRAEYVGWLNAQVLGPAEWMREVIRANYACATQPGEVHIPEEAPACEVGGTRGATPAVLVRQLPAEALVDLLGAGQVEVLDVREPQEFIGPLGHLPGARLVPLGTLSQRLGELTPLREREVVVVCRSGNRSASGASALSAAGFARVSSLQGGMLRWNELGLPVTRAEESEQPYSQ